MDFWIIQAQENPAAPRDEPGRREWRSNTLAEVLSDRGHAVTRWRSSFSHQAKVQLTDGSQRLPHDTYHQHFIESPEYRRHIGLKRIRNHRALERNFARDAAGYARPNLIHVGNVPIELCYAAVRYGVQHKLPVVIDVRDLWPDIYLDVLPRPLKPLRPLGQGLLDLTSFNLKYAFRNATAITALTQSYLDWGLDKAGRAQHDRDAIFPMCYPGVEIAPSDAEVAAVRAKLDLAPDDVLACYFGNIGRQSDFDGIVATARLLQTRAPQLKFIIAGSGPREEEIRRAAADLPNVRVPGWVQGGEVQALMSVSTFGLVIYNPVPNYLRNLPNKYSEYLAGGQVIVCGLEGEMANATRDGNCGFVYPSGDAGALADRLVDLMGRPDDLAAMSAAARHLHKTRFDGSQLYDRFADYLTALADQGKGST